MVGKKETRFLSPWFLPQKRNRVSVVNITVNFCRQKRNPVSEFLVFDTEERNRVSVVNITVNCGSKKRNPVSESHERAIAFGRGDRFFVGCDRFWGAIAFLWGAIAFLGCDRFFVGCDRIVLSENCLMSHHYV